MSPTLFQRCRQCTRDYACRPLPDRTHSFRQISTHICRLGVNTASDSTERINGRDSEPVSRDGFEYSARIPTKQLPLLGKVIELTVELAVGQRQFVQLSQDERAMIPSETKKPVRGS